MTTFLSKNKKQLVTDEKELICPYCNQGGFIQLHPKHLKTHGKTVDDVRKEFPDYPTMTTERYNIQLSSSNIGGEGTKQKMETKPTKIVLCYYNNLDDCSHETKEVLDYLPSQYLCETCRRLERKPIDGRYEEDANIKREKTFSEKYNVRNAIFLKK